MMDSSLKKILQNERRRQESVWNLIASENYMSDHVIQAMDPILSSKYAEGYSGRRYYGGNSEIDAIESLCQKRALEAFNLSEKKWAVNVQAHSGSPANLAILNALAPLGKKIMALSLSEGGHLSHGYRVSLTGKLWEQIPYGTNPKTGKIDYKDIETSALKHKPVVIIVGQSAYPRIFSYPTLKKIAKKCGAYLVADISHEAGLVATGIYPSPFSYADVVMMTTHKTLRGPRGALIFSRKDSREIPSRIDASVFPGLQGGPHMQSITGISQALYETTRPSFKAYTRRVLDNADALSTELKRLGWNIISGGTDNHIVLVDVYGTVGIAGREAQELLEREGIIVNKNMIPHDTRKPNNPSGIRLGTPAETTRGKKKKDFITIAQRIDKILRSL